MTEIKDNASAFLLAIEGYWPWQERLPLLQEPDCVEQFLYYVKNTVPLYSTLDLPDQLSLADFPLVSKNDLMSRPDLFVSRMAASSASLFSFTSGTTGLKMAIRTDLAAWYDENCATYATVFSAIPSLSESLAPGKLAVALVTNKVGRERFAMPLPSLKFAMFERMPIGEEEEDAHTLHLLRSVPVSLLYGKPTYLLDLLELDKCHAGPRVQPRAILTSGENLFVDVRCKLEEWFGCDVYDAYVSTEGGLVALECSYHRGLHVQTNRVTLEILCSDKQVRSCGSGEIVLTNLANRATAVVRYKTEDFGTLIDDECPCGFRGPSLSQLQGREAVFFEGKERICHTSDLDMLLLKFPLREFQLEQTGIGDFTFRWVPRNSEAVTPELEGSILEGLSALLGSVTIQSARERRITARGGKARRYIGFP